MDLYAKATSERATKAQGGNKFIDISINNKKKETLFYLEVVPHEETFKIKRIGGTQGVLKEIVVMLTQEEQQTKGNKQKSELCNCGRNAGFHVPQDNCN